MTSYSTFIATTTPSGLFIAGLAIIGVVLVMRSTARRTMKLRAASKSGSVSVSGSRSGSRSGSATPVRERYAQLSRESTAARSLGNVMAEMDELSRQIHGRLDTKIAKLEAIIRDADDRIARLEQIARTPPSPERQPGATPSLDITLDSESPLEFETPTPQNLPGGKRTAGEPLDEAHAGVYALAGRGLSADEIAAELSRPVGEIELILSLRETGTKSATH